MFPDTYKYHYAFTTCYTLRRFTCIFVFFSTGFAAGNIPDFRSFADQIERQTGRTIAYSASDINIQRSDFPDIEGMTAEQALRQVLDAGTYNLITTGNHIVIRKNHDLDVVDMYIPAENPPVNSERVAPGESVFSGETCLIIIRDRDVTDIETPSESSERVSRAGNAYNPGQASSAGVVGQGPRSVAAAGEPSAQRIPFRWDLYETQAYNNVGDDYGFEVGEPLATETTWPAQVEEGYLRPFVMGVQGPEPRPAEPDGDPTASEIPFRWDLFETQAYTPADEVDGAGSFSDNGPAPEPEAEMLFIGLLGPEPRPAEPDGDPTAVAIPFRTDLLDTQVYQPNGETLTELSIVSAMDQTEANVTGQVRPFVTGTDGPEPRPVEPDGDPTAVEIRFRPDVADTQTYQPADEVKTKTRRRNRR